MRLLRLSLLISAVLLMMLGNNCPSDSPAPAPAPSHPSSSSPAAAPSTPPLAHTTPHTSPCAAALALTAQAGPAPRVENAHFDMKTETWQFAEGVHIVRFYTKTPNPYNDSHYYAFTNFYKAPICVATDPIFPQRPWPSTEHYFQAQKFKDNVALQERIRAAASGREAFTIARQHNKDKRADWEDVKAQAMLDALWAKFTQHPSLQTLLLHTGHSILIENTYASQFGNNALPPAQVDGYWGDGLHLQGLNMLGEMLMHIRERLNGHITPGTVFTWKRPSSL